MDMIHARPKMVSEEKRERDVFLLYGAAFRNLPSLDDFDLESDKYTIPKSFVPRPSTDSTLTALAQLATLRLNAGRALISLIDRERQYILAEATSTTSIRDDTPNDASHSLLFGSVSIPRSKGLCKVVLDIDAIAEQTNNIPTVILEDTHKEVGDFIKEDRMRFYAGTPLTSPTGAIVGALCIMDEKPRTKGFGQEEQKSLQDVAHSVIEYLHSYTIKEQYRRGEKFTRGLISFSEGASDILPFKETHESDAQTISVTRQDHFPLHSHTSADMATNMSRNQQEETKKKTATGAEPKSTRQWSIRQLQEDMLPLHSKSMFARAANVMMASSDLDGVLILDASIATSKKRKPRTGDASTEPSDTDYESSSQSKTHSSDYEGERSLILGRNSSSTTCPVLGCATSATIEPGSAADVRHHSFPETDLVGLLNDFPQGKIITFDSEGIPLSSAEESHSSDDVQSPDDTSKRKIRTGRSVRHTKALQALFPKARSVVFTPFWDYERSRWFAGCLCWSDNTHNLRSASVDLAYFKVFSHSIMRELSRLDALTMNQAKTTFVSSISHELRSPLHGILGTLEFLKDTSLDSFQTSMFNSLSACSQTLLDTINHVMDHAKISEMRRNVSSKTIKNANTIRLSSKPLKNRKSHTGAFDLGIVTEEVVEAVFSGSTYIPMAASAADEPISPSAERLEQSAKRKNCYIVLDIAHEENWTYCFPIGSWRRVVMNIFGNAIKYTDSGHIQVSLRTSEGSKAAGVPTTVTLSITDSGKGMSPHFLANKAFEPFSQESSFSAGTGLGLSIVKQIVELDGGKLEITSEQAVGTQITVRLALSRPQSLPAMLPQRSEYFTFLSRLENRRVCILSRDAAALSVRPDLTSMSQGLIRFTNSLANTLEKQLRMRVVRSEKWTGHDSELVIVPELSFEYLSAIRRSRGKHEKAPVTVFVAMDALEAATLRSDARVRGKESVVEIMTQPCGPYKLAYILNKCLDRYARPEENLQHQTSGNQSPITGVPDDKRLLQRNLTLNLSSAAEDTIPEHSLTKSSPIALVAPVPLPNGVRRERSPHRSSPSHVLIVDDNAINRRLLVSFLRKHKYEFQEAQNGLEALEAYRKQPPKFSIILMDMSMPVMDGMTSTRAIRQYEEANGIPSCSIIALTGLTSASARLEALTSGVDEFLTKPVNFKALGELMKKMGQKNSEEDVSYSTPITSATT